MQNIRTCTKVNNSGAYDKLTKTGKMIKDKGFSTSYIELMTPRRLREAINFYKKNAPVYESIFKLDSVKKSKGWDAIKDKIDNTGYYSIFSKEINDENTWNNFVNSLKGDKNATNAKELTKLFEKTLNEVEAELKKDPNHFLNAKVVRDKFIPDTVGVKPISLNDKEKVKQIEKDLKDLLKKNYGAINGLEKLSEMNRMKNNPKDYKMLIEVHKARISLIEDDLKDLYEESKRRFGNAKIDLTPSGMALMNKFRISPENANNEEVLKYYIKSAEEDKAVLPELVKFEAKYKSKGWDAIKDEVNNPKVVKWMHGSKIDDENEFKNVIHVIHTDPTMAKIDEFTRLVKSALKEIKDRNVIGNTRFKDSDNVEYYTVQYPNGKWYYQSGYNNVVGPYESEDEAIKWLKKHRPTVKKI